MRSSVMACSKPKAISCKSRSRSRHFYEKYGKFSIVANSRPTVTLGRKHNAIRVEAHVVAKLKLTAFPLGERRRFSYKDPQAVANTPVRRRSIATTSQNRARRSPEV